MAKLRVVKERQSDVAVANDLRGLGHTSLFHDMTPDPMLTIQGDWTRIKAIAQEFHIETHPDAVTTDGVTHLHCIANHLSHKEKALNLLAFAVIAHVKLGHPMLIWEHKRLHHELQEGFEGHKIPMQIPSIELSKGLSLEAGIQIYARQAGFLLPHGAETLHLQPHDLQSLVSQLRTQPLLLPDAQGVA